MKDQCCHDESDVHIFSITPAESGWAHASLDGSTKPNANPPDLDVEPIVMWALVDLTAECECPRQMVVPMVAGSERLRLELPSSYVDGDYFRDTAIVRPGWRPIFRRVGRYHLFLEPGDWTAEYDPERG